MTDIRSFPSERWVRGRRTGVLAFVALLAIGGARSEPQSGARCSDLPEAVATKAAAIRDAALTRDYDALLALTDSADFSYSFGDDGGDPTVYWRALDLGGDDVPAAIVALLEMPCAVVDWGGPLNYVWPAAFEIPYSDLSEAERAGLVALYQGMDIEYYYMDGPENGYYAGWRLVIDESGRWT